MFSSAVPGEMLCSLLTHITATSTSANAYITPLQKLVYAR